MHLCFCSVLQPSSIRGLATLYHGRTYSIIPFYLCSLSFWLTLPRGVLSTYWCCTSRPCVVFLVCLHLALFLALSLPLSNSLVSSWWPQYTSFLALTVSNNFSFVKNRAICFLCCPRNPQNLSQLFHLKGAKTCFFILSAFTAVLCNRPH